MGFNFGAFAGGLAKGGMDTYKALTDIESQKKRDELVDLQARQVKAELQGKEALRSAIADQGGENTFTPNFSGTGGMDTNDVAPTPVRMSASERRSAIEQRAIAGGADPEAAMRYTAARRTADLSGAFDTTMEKLYKESADRISSIRTTAETGGMKGLVDTFGPELKKAFGQDVQFKAVPGGAGEIVAMDGKKVIGRYRNINEATQALEGLVAQEFETKFSKAMMQPGMFGSSKELSDYLNKQAELRNQNISANASSRSADAAMKSAEAAVTNAATNKQAEAAKSKYYLALANKAGQSLTAQKLELIEANSAIIMRANPNMTKAQADLRAAQELFRSPEARANVVTAADVNKFLETHADDPEMKVKDKSGKMVLRPIEERAAYARRVLGGGGEVSASPANPTEAALSRLSAGGADPFAPKSNVPPGAVDTETVPPPPTSAIPAGPRRYGNIDPAMQDRLQADVNAIDRQISEAEAALRALPNMTNAQNLQRLRAERDKLAANPLLR